MDTSVLGLDGLKLTFVDKSGMVVGELARLSRLFEAFHSSLLLPYSGLWFTGISYGILLLQLAFYIRAKAADP